MQTNYYFLKKLSTQIAVNLHANWRLGFANENINQPKDKAMCLKVCFSQNKDELVLGFANDSEEFYIKAVLDSSFTCLAFPNDFARAKRNSIDLFANLIDLRVLNVVQYVNERCFVLEFEQNYRLLFKMHGRRSNIVLFENQDFVIGFHKKLVQDQEIKIEQLDRPIAQTYDAFQHENGDWKKLFPTFGAEIGNYLHHKNIKSLSLENQWTLIEETLQILENPVFYVFKEDLEVQFSLLPTNTENIAESTNPIEAVNAFYYNFNKISYLDKEKRDALKDLQKRSKQVQTYLDKNLERLMVLEDGSQNEETANILMANLHQIPANVSSIELYDFYKDQNRVFKLKKELSPQKNAENFYRKAKNEKIEVQTLQKNLELKEKELEEINQHLENITQFENLKELRKYLRDNKLIKVDKSENPQETLFKKFQFQGWDIWIGKNAKNNDLLTQKYAFKDDLWLHAKDVSGSHVIIKYQSGKTFPSDVIAKAASLAAYYSKRSNDTLCPVLYTPKKYVRKTKDLTEGQVLVEKEEVIMVVPEKF